MIERKRKSKLRKIFSYVMAMLLMFSTFLPFTVGIVHAQDKTITGKCEIKMIKHAFAPNKTEFAVKMPDGKTYHGYCIDLGAPTPADGAYTFTGTLNGSGSYDIVVNSDKITRDKSDIHPADRDHLNGKPPWKLQRVGGFTYKVDKNGKLKLKKITKSNKKLTDLCPENYSIAGAQYGVYKDSSLKDRVGTLETNESGDSNEITLKKGTYYIKEIAAPKGYKLDQKTYRITVNADDTAVLKVADEPLFDPLRLSVEKRAASGADKSLSLEGAEYTIKYYKQYFNKESETGGKTPFRTWIFKTKKMPNGKIGFLLDEKYKIGGDKLFKDENGRALGLLGTYTIEETKAPKGFVRTEGLISVQQVKPGNTNEGVTTLKDVTDIEKAQTISITLRKIDKETGQSKPQGYGTIKGAKYKLSYRNKTSNSWEKIADLVTDRDGIAKYENGKPGLYKLEEIESSKGYVLDKEVHEIEAEVKEGNKKNFNYDVVSKEQPTTVKVFKVSTDKKTGEKINLKGAKLQLLDSRGNKIEEWISDGKGKTFKGLEIGKNYRIKEIKAPKGYEIAKDIEFTVSKDGNQIITMIDEKIVKNNVTPRTDDGRFMPEIWGCILILAAVSYRKIKRMKI